MRSRGTKLAVVAALSGALAFGAFASGAPQHRQASRVLLADSESLSHRRRAARTSHTRATFRFIARRTRRRFTRSAAGVAAAARGRPSTSSPRPARSGSQTSRLRRAHRPRTEAGTTRSTRSPTAPRSPQDSARRRLTLRGSGPTSTTARIEPPSFAGPSTTQAPRMSCGPVASAFFAGVRRSPRGACATIVTSSSS